MQTQWNLESKIHPFWKVNQSNEQAIGVMVCWLKIALIIVVYSILFSLHILRTYNNRTDSQSLRMFVENGQGESTVQCNEFNN